MDFTADGIQNSFTFELVDVNNLNASYGYLEGVTGGSVTEGYYTDNRIAATIDLVGTRIASNQAVRIWHTAQLGDETYTHALGTFMVEKDAPTLEHGVYSGTVNLESMLAKFDDDLRCGDRGVGQEAIVPWFKSVVTNAFAVPYVSPNLSTTKTFTSWVWEHAKSVYWALSQAASAINARVDVDETGRITLMPYTAPSVKDSTFTIDGMVLAPGFTNELGDIVNRCIVKYDQNGKDENDNDLPTLYGDAQVAKTHPWHPSKIGRWYTKEYSETEPSDPTASGIQKLAEHYLAENSGRTSKWEGSGLWVPYRVGEVGWVSYVDSDTGESKSARMMIQQKEYNLDALMETKYIFDELDV